MKPKTIRPLTIKNCLNGYLVEIGCQTVVFDSISALTRTLERYLEDPEKVEKDFGWEPTVTTSPNQFYTITGQPIQMPISTSTLTVGNTNV